MSSDKIPSVKISSQPTPLIIETHPKNYNGYPFLTLIQYRKIPMLTIVDNIDNEVIRAYVLDLCEPEDIDKELLFQVAADWYDNDLNNFPISIAFSKAGMTKQTSKIYRVLNIELVSRFIGLASKFPVGNIKSIKRRRRKLISTGIEIVEVGSTEEEDF
jgi:hypothetical protein